MKKVLLFISLIFSIVKVNALSIELSCPSFASKGDNITISAYLNKEEYNDNISAIEGRLSYDKDNVNLLNYKLELTKWVPFSVSDTFAFGNITYDNLITETNTLIFKTNFKVKEAAEGNIHFSIDNLGATDSNGNYIDTISSNGCIVPIVSNVNTLSNIELDDGQLFPLFSPDILVYSTTTRNNTITINYKKDDDKSTVICNCENIKLNYGTNTIKITVISESKIERIYTININRLNDIIATETEGEEEIWLKSLKLSSGSINFDSNKTLYNVTVDGKVSSIKISSTLGSSKYNYIDWEKEKTVALEYGLNEINIFIKSDTGDVKIYKINITRKDDRNTDNSLKNIIVSKGNLVFDPNVLEYILNVDNNIDKIDIEPKLSSNKSKYEISGPDNLEVGENIYRIKVTAENNDSKTYTIKVIRNKEGVVLSSVALLQSLNIEGYNIDFKENKFKYKIFSNDTEFNISAIPKEGATYYVLNSGTVNEENELVVRVTAEDGTINNYVIEVKKIKSVENTKTNIIIPIIIISILFIVALICFIYIGKYKTKK